MYAPWIMMCDSNYAPFNLIRQIWMIRFLKDVSIESMSVTFRQRCSKHRYIIFPSWHLPLSLLWHDWIVDLLIVDENTMDVEFNWKSKSINQFYTNLMYMHACYVTCDPYFYIYSSFCLPSWKIENVEQQNIEIWRHDFQVVA